MYNYPRMEKSNNLLKILLLLLPVCVFYLLVVIFSADIPGRDDYYSLLEFANNFFPADFHDKFALLFSQHNEHRIFFCRVLGLVTYFLTGTINFKILILIGSISLIGIGIISFFSTVLSKRKIKPVYFIPAIFLLFQLRYLKTVFMATSSVSNLWVLFFAFLSLYLLTDRSTRSLILSLLFAVSATFTNGNGMFLFFIGLIALGYEKRYKELILWSLVGAVCILAYFWGYIKPAQHPSIVNSIFVHPIRTVTFFFCFLGSCFSKEILGNQHVLALCSGMLFALCYLFLFITKYYKKNPPLFLFLSYLFIAGAAASLTRSGMGVTEALHSRHSIISVLFLTCLYLAALDYLPEKNAQRFFPALLTLAVLFNFYSNYSNYKHTVDYRKYLISTLASRNSGMMYKGMERENLIMSTAIERGYYIPPEIPDKKL